MILSQLCIENGVTVLPVDSEHSAMFQSLVGESFDSIEKLYLTASEGLLGGSLDYSFLMCLTTAFKTPQLGNGSKNNHRLCFVDEQGLRTN